MLGDLAYSPGFLSKIFVGDFRPRLFEFRRRRPVPSCGINGIPSAPLNWVMSPTSKIRVVFVVQLLPLIVRRPR
jgi:hypothetical protein